MATWLLEPVYWNWWLLGVVLMIAEVLLPGMYVLWMGIGALGVGIVVYLLPGISGQLQWLLFAIFTVASILLWRLYLKKNPPQSENPLLNLRGQQYVGRLFTLEAPAINGYGKIRVDDSMWKVEITDCPAGSQIRIVGVNGTVLKGKLEN